MHAETCEPASRLTSFAVGDWLVDPKACQISRDGVASRLRPQLVDLLVCLARRPGRIVLKEEILQEVWPGQFIAESGLSRCVAELRHVLHDDAQQPRYIEAIRKRGYRLVAPVVWTDDAAPAEPTAEGGASGPDAVEPGTIAASAVPAGGAAVEPPVRRRRWWLGIGLGVAAVAVVGTVLLTRSPASVLTEQDLVLLAFENSTGDSVFDETIPLAMSIQLEQSPYLMLPSPERLREALTMMRRAPDTPLTRAVGMELCERVGGKALIVTSIAALGRQYAIGVEAVACGSGRVLTRQQVTAEAREQVLTALQRVAKATRQVVGEPTASVERFSTPAVQATTSSLDALRALRRGDMARAGGRSRVALDFYRQAATLDPDFALAHLRIGVIAIGAGGSEAEYVSAFDKAMALRHRATFPERLEIEAAYHHANGEYGKVVEALGLLTKAYPRRAEHRVNLSMMHLRVGRIDDALAEAIEAQRIEPDAFASLIVLGRAHLAKTHIEEARVVAERALSLGAPNAAVHLVLFQCGLATGDQALLARERAWAAEHPEMAASSVGESEAEDAMSRGRLQASLEYLREFESQAAARGQPGTAAMIRLRMARYEALCGLRTQALDRVRQEMRRGVSDWLKIDLVKVAVSAGDFDLAARLLDEIDRDGLSGGAQPTTTLARAYRAAVAAHQGRVGQALEQLMLLEPFDLGLAFGFIPLLERAQAHLSAGEWAAAKAAFEKIIAHPTIDSGKKLVPLAQIGLARTLARSGDVAGSRRAYEQFFERWRNADSRLPLLEQARQEYRALSPPGVRS